MANYIIIGGDHKEYEAVTADVVRQWIAENRLNEQSLVKVEGETEFRPLGTFPEFISAFVASQPLPKLPPLPPLAGRADWSQRDYELDIGGCIARGWELVKNNLGVLFVGTLIYVLIEGAIGGLARIPIVGALFSIANLVISGPLMGGVFYMFIRAIRNEPAEVGDIFSGFSRAFGQLFLGLLVQGLLIAACLLPFIIVFALKFIPVAGQAVAQMQGHSPPSPELLAAIKSALVVSLPFLLICAIPAIYLSVCWKFTLPLIMDKQMDFWTAMGTSRKMVNKHWWLIFGLLILISLLNLAGICACCVGVLFTLPVGLAALMFAYETIFCEGPEA